MEYQERGNWNLSDGLIGNLSRPSNPGQSDAIEKNATGTAFFVDRIELVTTALQLEWRCYKSILLGDLESTIHSLRLGNIVTCETMATFT